MESTENTGKRVLLAGLFHETHTFLEGITPLADFRVRRGLELFDAANDGSPLSGVLGVAEQSHWHVLPVIDLRATPSATAEDAVLETIWQEFREVAQREQPQGIDGIYLVLHGAMVCASFPDVEGELISRIRSLDGFADIPICGVLDLHGNISQTSVEQTQGLIVYRTNPHIDARAAAVDGAKLLDRIMSQATSPVTVWEQPAVMWPPTGTGTANDPMQALEAKARAIEAADSQIVAVNVFGGFSFADTPDTGVSFSAVTFGDPAVARAHLRELCAWTLEHREAGNVVEPALASVIPQVLAHVEHGETPVILVEPSDNIGGGAPGDGTGILRALLHHEIANSAVVINDPQAVEELAELTPGDHTELTIGGKGSRLDEGPLTLKVELQSQSDGRFDLEDHHSHLASMNGIHINMGPSAVVRAGGVRILLTSLKTPPFDLGQLRSQGIEPESLSVIGVKAAVAHRRAYDKITKVSYTVATPGPCSSDLKTFPFEKVRRPIFPLDD